MKILQINSVCGVGSTGRIAVDLHNSFKEEGFDSFIGYGRNEALNCNETIKIGTKFNNYKHVARTRLFDQHGFGSKKATIRFIEEVEQVNPDIIHLHNIHGYYLNVEILFDYLKEVNKPVVWTLHDCWPFTGHCSYFEYAGCECWRPDGDHYCIQKKEYPQSWLVNNSKKNYYRKEQAFTGLKNMTIVTPSKWLANLVKQSFLKDYPVKVINNGIDADVFKPRKNDFKRRNNIDNKFMILGVANIWDLRKGLKYFLDLSEQLNIDEEIVLVGLTNKQLESLPENIIGISRTDSIQELAEIYSAADVFLNPTLEDNFPTTNLESLACGTPVITFDTGGSPEAIDSKTGIVTDTKTTDSILKALSEIKENPERKNACVERSKIFNKEKMFSQYKQLYQEKINRHI